MSFDCENVRCVARWLIDWGLACSALFNDADLEAPEEQLSEEEAFDDDEDLDRESDEESDKELDDEFDLGDETAEGVTLEDFEGDFEMTAAE